MGVLLFIFDIKCLKESFLHCRIILRAIARAFLKAIRFSSVLYETNFLYAAFLERTAFWHNTENQALFFRGLGDVLGMCLFEISSRDVTNLLRSGSKVGLRVWEHSLENSSQLALLKLKRLGIGVVCGMSGLHMIGKWSEPCRSSRTDH